MRFQVGGVSLILQGDPQPEHLCDFLKGFVEGNITARERSSSRIGLRRVVEDAVEVTIPLHIIDFKEFFNHQVDYHRRDLMLMLLYFIRELPLSV